MIKGKQLKDKTLSQNKLNLENPVNDQDAATKEYVDLNYSTENSDTSDVNLQANLVTIDGQLATDTGITNQPVVGTYVGVVVNGKSEDIGDNLTDAGYFSPDGVFKRTQGAMRQDDKLYWNPSNSFMLDTNDIIEFNYLTNANFGNVVQLEDGDEIPFDGDVQTNMYDLNGGDGTTVDILIDETDVAVSNVLEFGVKANSESYKIQNDNGNLIFDVGNVNGHLTTFTNVGESIDIRVKSNFTVIYDGGDINSQKLSIVKKSLQETIPVVENLSYIVVKNSDRKVFESFDAETWTEIDMGGESYTYSSETVYCLNNVYRMSISSIWQPIVFRFNGYVIEYRQDGNHKLNKVPGNSDANAHCHGNDDGTIIYNGTWNSEGIRRKPPGATTDTPWPIYTSSTWYPGVSCSTDAQHVITGGWNDVGVQVSHDYGLTYNYIPISGHSDDVALVHISDDGQKFASTSSKSRRMAYSLDAGSNWTILPDYANSTRASRNFNVITIDTASTTSTIYLNDFATKHVITGTKTRSNTSGDGSRIYCADMLSSGDIDMHYSLDNGVTWNVNTITTPWAGGTTIFPALTTPNEHYLTLTGSTGTDDMLILDKDTCEVLSIVTPPFGTFAYCDIKDWHV